MGFLTTDLTLLFKRILGEVRGQFLGVTTEIMSTYSSKSTICSILRRMLKISTINEPFYKGSVFFLSLTYE